MPYARNTLDDKRIYFEDEGGAGTPVVILGGFLDPVDVVRGSPIARALQELRAEFRLIYVDPLTTYLVRHVGRCFTNSLAFQHHLQF